MAKEDGHESRNNSEHGHDFRTESTDGAFMDGGKEVSPITKLVFCAAIFDGVIEVKKHDDAGFCIETCEGN